PCPVEDRATRFVGFNVRQSRAERKSDDGANRNAATEQIARRDTHPRRVHTDGCEVIGGSFLAEFLDVVVSCFGFEERVVYQAGPFPRRSRLAQHEADTRSACVVDAVDPLMKAMEALRRATTHLRLLDAVAIEASNNGVRNLIN